MREVRSLPIIIHEESKQLAKRRLLTVDFLTQNAAFSHRLKEKELEALIEDALGAEQVRKFREFLKEKKEKETEEAVLRAKQDANRQEYSRKRSAFRTAAVGRWYPSSGPGFSEETRSKGDGYLTIEEGADGRFVVKAAVDMRFYSRDLWHKEERGLLQMTSTSNRLSTDKYGDLSFVLEGKFYAREFSVSPATICEASTVRLQAGTTELIVTFLGKKTGSDPDDYYCGAVYFTKKKPKR